MFAMFCFRRGHKSGGSIDYRHVDANSWVNSEPYGPYLFYNGRTHVDNEMYNLPLSDLRLETYVDGTLQYVDGMRSEDQYQPYLFYKGGRQLREDRFLRSSNYCNADSYLYDNDALIF